LGAKHDRLHTRRIGVGVRGWWDWFPDNRIRCQKKSRLLFTNIPTPKQNPAHHSAGCNGTRHFTSYLTQRKIFLRVCARDSAPLGRIFFPVGICQRVNPTRLRIILRLSNQPRGEKSCWKCWLHAFTAKANRFNMQTSGKTC
jgi:hypothetical protein